MFITWLSVWGTANKCRISDLTVIWQVIKFSNTDYPCKKEPGIPRNSGEKFLAFLASLHIRKSQEKARKSQECPGPPGFPGIPGKARRAWKENFLAFRAFLYVQKSPELLTRMIAGTPWLFLDSGVSWKAWKNQKKISTLSGLFLMCKKKPGASDWNNFWHILVFPWFRGFLESLEKPGKAKRKFTTWHSWLLLDCGVT